MKFEDKVKELEKIINDLENDSTNLDESIDKYTKAMKLAKECNNELNKVEEKISKLIDENNEVKDFNVE